MSLFPDSGNRESRREQPTRTLDTHLSWYEWRGSSALRKPGRLPDSPWRPRVWPSVGLRLPSQEGLSCRTLTSILEATSERGTEGRQRAQAVERRSPCTTTCS